MRRLCQVLDVHVSGYYAWRRNPHSQRHHEDQRLLALRKEVDGVRQRVLEKLSVIPVTSAKAADRHGSLPDGTPRPYKGYKGDSNYCIEIVRDEASGKWLGEVISTFQAYQVIREHGMDSGWKMLRSSAKSLSGRSLVMRLMIDDVVRLKDKDSETLKTWRVAKISGKRTNIFCRYPRS